MSILNFPSEILVQIFSNLERKQVCRLPEVCSLFKFVVDDNKRYLLATDSGYVLNWSQMSMYESVRKSTRKIVAITSPMGSGKTAMAIMLAKDVPGPVIIVIRSRIFTTWINEITKFGFTLNPDPKKSDILIVHTIYKKHHEYIVSNGGKLDKHKIVITTPFYLKKSEAANRATTTTTTTNTTTTSKNRMYFNDKLINNSTLIVDEAHLLLPKGFMVHERAKKSYLFSAAELRLNQNADLIKINELDDIKKYPKLDWQIRTFGGFEDITEEDIMSKIDELDQISPFKNLVLFNNYNPQSLKRLNLFINKYKPKHLDNPYIAYTFVNTTISTLDKFRKSSKAIILCTYLTAAEGINLDTVDSAVFLDFETMGNEKSRQAVGRIRRFNSKNHNIRTLFLIRDDDVRYSRACMNILYSTDLNFPDFEKKQKTAAEHICVTLRKKGYNLKNMTLADIFVLFAFNVKGITNFKETDFSIPITTLLNICHAITI